MQYNYLQNKEVMLVDAAILQYHIILGAEAYVELRNAAR